MELVVVRVLEASGEFVEEVQQLGGGLIGELGFGKPEGRFPWARVANSLTYSTLAAGLVARSCAFSAFGSVSLPQDKSVFYVYAEARQGIGESAGYAICRDPTRSRFARCRLCGRRMSCEHHQTEPPAP